MKWLLKIRPHKLVMGILIFLLIYLSLYELWWTNIPSWSQTTYKVGLLVSFISYSIAAACIFYLITQYLGYDLPKNRRKINIVLPYIHRQAVTLNTILHNLQYHMNIAGNDFKNDELFDTALDNIYVDKPVGNHSNWHQYLHEMKFQILDIIRGFYFYHEYLSEDFLHEVILIEQRLMSPVTFVGYKEVACSDLSFGKLDIQEILIHNSHLQVIRQNEAKKYKKQFEASSKKYRQRYYSDQGQ